MIMSPSKVEGYILFSGRDTFFFFRYLINYELIGTKFACIIHLGMTKTCFDDLALVFKVTAEQKCHY